VSQTIVIRSNASAVTAIRVPDLGTDVPPAGGSLTFTERDPLFDCSQSLDVPVLATDNGFGAGQHSLILNDGTADVAPGDVAAFLANLTTIQGNLPYELFGAGSGGSVGDPTDYAGRFEGASVGTGDIPLNKWGWWYDTVNSLLFEVRNRDNILHFVEAYP
jgi:hypothetical protein